MMTEELLKIKSDIKIKNRNAARRMKNGSPEIHKILRQVFIFTYIFILVSSNDDQKSN